MRPSASPRVSVESIASLLATKRPEGRQLDYKLTLPGSADREVKEFLADVSSFANTAGGLLVVGVSEENGVPVEATGLSTEDLDAAIARLEGFIRDGIEPRLPGVQILPVEISGKHLLVLDIPRSWASPHAVTARGHWRFYARNSAGKYPLDVGELRGAFEYSASSQERISASRSRRLSAILAGETPVAFTTGATTVLHIIPFNSLDPAFSVDLATAAANTSLLRPIYGASAWSHTYSLEGFAAFSRQSSQEPADTYTVIMRDGVLEAANTGLLEPWEGQTGVPGHLFEQKILEAMPGYLRLLSLVGVTTPVAVLISLLRVRGYFMVADTLRFRQISGGRLTRDELLLPGVTLDDLEAPPAQALRPVFDTIWNAFGYERSPSYDEQGNWRAGAR